MTNLWTSFTAVADDKSASIALIFGDRQISFGELKGLARRCSAYLARLGVRRGAVVALQLPKRIETYALLLACLRLGAPYVFIDPKAPEERCRRTIARVRPVVLFTTAETENPNGTVVHLPRESWDLIDQWTDDNPGLDAPLTGADPAYIMFTSGSTGEPKGAVIPHQGVLSLIAWARRDVIRRQAERFTNINPLHFDNSVFDIYCGLFNGAALVPIETGEQTNPASWVRIMREAEASVTFAVPTLFLILDSLGLLDPATLPKIETFVFGGEGFPVGRLRDFHARFQSRARLINVYGPTETSCICASRQIDAASLDTSADSLPPLGKMHDGFSFVVLDESEKQVEAGQVGELWIGGPCVGLGYYANPEETKLRFRQDPRQDCYRSILYRSGDLVREDADGELWFHGRVDNQVKIRGHRIELEEVDLAIQSMSGVRRAITVALVMAGETELHVAFEADRDIAAEEIQDYCRSRLPAYMRPARAVQIADLPRNANGKIDRKAIKEILGRMVRGGET